MKTANINGFATAYRVFGNEPVGAVVMPALGSLQAEWWPLCERISSRISVMTYDRAGYGASGKPACERSPKNIAAELVRLLATVGHRPKLVLIGHSLGGLYCVQFAKEHPDMVAAVLLLDPLSPHDDQFRELLTPKEYSQSGVDKSLNMRLGLAITRLGLGFALKPLLKKLPPFMCCSDYTAAATRYILKSLTEARLYRTALAEYRLAHSVPHLYSVAEPADFPDVPLVLITHSSQTAIDEITKYGGASAETAGKVERIWQELMADYLRYSPQARHVQAQKANHFIHLMEPELVCTQLEFIIMSRI